MHGVGGTQHVVWGAHHLLVHSCGDTTIGGTSDIVFDGNEMMVISGSDTCSHLRKGQNLDTPHEVTLKVEVLTASTGIIRALQSRAQHGYRLLA